MNKHSSFIKLLIATTLVLMLGTYSSCEKPPPERPLVTQLKADRAQMEKDLAGFDEKIKQTDDVGLRNRLTEDKELLKSRLARVKEILKKENPPPPGEPDPNEAPAAAHH